MSVSHSPPTTPPPAAGVSQLLHLTDEQVRTWTLEQKDRWWLEKVFKGDMPQLTLRAAITGFILGGALSATNLYVGAKTGWTLGVGLTSVILAFAMFKALSQMGFRDFSILENNCMQSIATSAGYMTQPLVAGMAAYMWVQNEAMVWWQMMAFNIVLSTLGVLVAFPMKRRFINDEQQPFPEGRACGVVLHTLYTSDARVGLFKAYALLTAAFSAAALKIISAESIMHYVQVRVLGFQKSWHLPDHLNTWYDWIAEKGILPKFEAKILGVKMAQIDCTPTLEVAMFGAGGLMGLRVAGSMMIGMVANFMILIPIMVSYGEIQPKSGSLADGTATFTRAQVLNDWGLWWGIALMVAATMTSLFAKPKQIVSAFSGLFRKREVGKQDVLGHIELPTWISYVGVPVIGGIGVWMAHSWFGVSWLYGAMAIPLILVLTLIAANSTALTSITPTGSISKIPQFLFGALDPKVPATNLMTGVMCAEVAGNASNLLMDIKPGYMLGAKPRQQAIGHIIGIIAGALASTPLFFIMFMSDIKPDETIQDAMSSSEYSFPGAVQWKGVSDLVVAAFSGTGKDLVRKSAWWSMGIAAALGVALELIRIFSRNRLPLSPLAIGLGVVITPNSTIGMFAGAVFFTFMQWLYAGRRDSTGYKLWIETHEPICAGLIAGFALLGIVDVLVKVFLLKG